MKGVKFVLYLLPFFLPCALFAQEIMLRGQVTDPQGNALPDASVQLVEHDKVLDHSTSGPHGQFLLKVKSPGEFIVKADDFMDQYVRELLPATPSASTTVLFTPGNPAIVDGATATQGSH